MPTMFILIAPPAVGFIAYFKMFGVVDNFAIFLFNIALFFTLLVAFMYKNFLKIKFFISWWAFVFPIAAMAISSMLMYIKTNEPILLILSYIMVAVTTIVVLIVIYQTIIHIKKHDICIQE
jgi:tellurite resistance protein